MPIMYLPMKLSRDEDNFLRHWLFEEFHYERGAGPAKRLQLQHGVVPAELSVLVAAAIPDPAEQQAATLAPPKAPPHWPWTANDFQARLADAHAVLDAGPGHRAENDP
jgi:hypothetical protein